MNKLVTKGYLDSLGLDSFSQKARVNGDFSIQRLIQARKIYFCCLLNKQTKMTLVKMPTNCCCYYNVHFVNIFSDFFLHLLTLFLTRVVSNLCGVLQVSLFTSKYEGN